ncbi:MAG: hypothetical protein RRB13_14115 [bacterium]|nr:hypothetical protein [bacterium]
MKATQLPIISLKPGEEIALRSLEGEVLPFCLHQGDAGLSDGKPRFWLQSDQPAGRTYLRRLPDRPYQVGRALFGSLSEIEAALEEKDYYFA